MSDVLNHHATVIIDSALVLQNQHHGELTEKQQKAIKTIIGNAEKFVHLYAEFQMLALGDVPSTLRHELGNQLTPIRGYSDLLTMGVIGTLNTAQLSHVEAIYDSTNALREEVDNIVAQARQMSNLKSNRTA